MSLRVKTPFGWFVEVKVTGGRWRSRGEVSGARVATVTSEVAHPSGEKAAGRGDVAKAGRRPLDDELGGHWQKTPGQTDKRPGWRDGGDGGDG